MYKNRILPYYTFLTKKRSSQLSENKDMILVNILLFPDPEPELVFSGSESGCSKSPGSEH